MDSQESVIIKHRRTSAQRQRLLARYRQSKLTLKQFAAQHDIGLSTLSKWLHSDRETMPAKVKFQEIPLPKPASRWLVEVVSPQGWIVRLQNGSDVQMLPQLLQALPC